MLYCNKARSFLKTDKQGDCYCDRKACNKDYICSSCYSRTILKRRIDLHFKCSKNEWFYSNIELTLKDIPFLNDKYFRFESFGELTSTLKVKNYFLICEKNTDTFFAFFTKMPHIISIAMNYYNIAKPCNCKILQSSYRKNNVDTIKRDFIDTTFTVYTDDFIKNNSIDINCEKKCIHCLKCYTHNNIAEISERLK